VDTIIIVVVVTAAMAAFQHFSKRPPAISADGNRVTLKAHWLYSGIGYVSIGLALLILTSAWEQLSRDTEARKTVGLLVGIFTCFVGEFAHDSRSRVTLTPSAIEAISAWRGSIVIAWKDVESISYSSINRWFVIRSNSGTTIRISAMFIGIQAFVAQTKLRLPSAVYGASFKSIAET
jgi:hypothetical protein